MKKLFFLLLFLKVNVIYSQITVTASLENLETEVNRMVTYTVTVTSSGSSVPKPVLPEIENVQIISRGQSQSISIINNNISASVTYSYGLVPRKEGIIHIPPSRVEFQGKVYETESFELKVHPEGQGPPQAQPQQQQQPSGIPDPFEEFFNDPFFSGRPNVRPVFSGEARLVPDKTEVYVNQPVRLSLKLHLGGNVEISLQGVEPLKLQGFWAQDPVGIQNPQPEGSDSVNGITRKIYTIQRQTIFPLSEGKKTISETKVYLILQAFMAHERRELVTKPVVITVKPLPKGAPSGFSGAVGQFNLASFIDKRKVKQNEALLLKIVIEGNGNIKTLPEPVKPDLTSFKLYKTSSSVNMNEYGDSGKKIFEFVLVPMQSGRLTIQPFVFIFFDPVKKTYKTLKSEPFTIEVEPSAVSGKENLLYFSTEKKNIQPVGEDIHYIKTSTGIKKYFFLHKTFIPFVIIGLDLFSLLIALGLYLNEKRLSSDIRLKRKTRAWNRFRSVWKNVLVALNASDTEKTVSLLEKALYDYLSDRLNVDRSKHIRSDIRDRLSKFKNGESLAERYDRIAEDIETIKYGKTTPEDLNTLAEDLKNFVESMESVKEVV